MVDFNEMRKKFPPKDPGKKKRNAAIKRIAQEYEMKKAELGGVKAPALKKGIVFYVVVIMGMLMVASLILSVAGKGGKRFASKQEQDVQKSLSNLAIALGRFRYHTGDWPTDEEGLDILASDKVIKRGWNGPYIRKGSDEYIVAFQFLPCHPRPFNERHLGLMHLVPLNHRIGELRVSPCGEGFNSRTQVIFQQFRNHTANLPIFAENAYIYIVI